MSNQIFTVCASQPQHTAAGNLLGKLYYGPFLESTLTREQRSGYPHNGGEHTLYLKLTLPDLKAFLELLQERYVAHEGLQSFIQTVQANFKKAYPRFAGAL